MKLLVIHRPDEPAATRVAMVEEFVDRCRSAGLVSIIEPVAKAPRRGGDWDWDAASSRRPSSVASARTSTRRRCR